ncbi:putative glycosidase CRH2 [Coemansia erecta]|nr:putative glycosidase CRH2 [Coemansia erecta]
MNRLFAFAVVVGALALNVTADTTCTEYSPCARDGYCNSNAMFCMWGLCDESKSYNSTSCWQPESCATQSTTFDSSSDAIGVSSYDGNPNKTPFVSIFEPNNAVVENGNLVLQMTYDSSGNKGFGATAESTHTIQYGTVTARIKTASIATGVVSAFIIRSDVIGDEIDFEWVGKDPSQVQTNFFYHNKLVYTNSEPYNIGSDSSADYHDYTIVWSADSVVWMVDNKTIRTLKRTDTYDSNSKTYRFPSARSRVGLSIWDGGNSGAKGTEEWAGYPTPWTANTVYKMYVESISIRCSGDDSASSSAISDEPTSSSKGSSSSSSIDGNSTPSSDREGSTSDSDDSSSDGGANNSGGNTTDDEDNTGNGDKTDSGASTDGGDTTDGSNTSGSSGTAGGSKSTDSTDSGDNAGGSSSSSSTDGGANSTSSSTEDNNGSQPTDSSTDSTEDTSSSAGQKCHIVTITQVSQL